MRLIWKMFPDRGKTSNCSFEDTIIFYTLIANTWTFFIFIKGTVRLFPLKDVVGSGRRKEKIMKA